MGSFEIAAILITLAALFSYLNHRHFRLPTTVGVMLIALVLSLALIVAGRLGLGIQEPARRFLASVDFSEALLHGMLAFLLFAGSLHVNLDDLGRQKWVIGILATGGVIASTLLVAFLFRWASGWLGLSVAWQACLLFGALISPTDPISVLGILKSAGAPRSLETKVAGESLFNDGMGVVIFLVLLELARGGSDFGVGRVVLLFLEEAAGGIALGLALGWLGYRMLKSVNNYQVEVLLTLAMVTGGFALADALHTSGPIAMVVAGLLVGNQGRAFAMSDETREHLDTFWELVDEILNAVLFVLIGLEVLVMRMSPRLLAAGLIAIPIVLLARWVSVGATVSALRLRRRFTSGAIRVLTWGGLRGGISVALALSLPPGPHRLEIVAVTYAVVIFSIAVQGLTVGPLVRRIVPVGPTGAAPAAKD